MIRVKGPAQRARDGTAWLLSVGCAGVKPTKVREASTGEQCAHRLGWTGALLALNQREEGAGGQ